MDEKQKNLIGDLFTQTEANLVSQFVGWENSIPHQGEKGGLRERRIGDLLATLLPKKYGIASGHIVDSMGAVSSQTDIIIYNAYEGFKFPIDNYYSLIPCECVYAVIEVKSKLTDKSIGECLKYTTQLKKLARNVNHGNLTPIYSLVFAYDCSWKGEKLNIGKKIINTIEKKAQNNRELKLPDGIFTLNPGLYLYSAGATGYNEAGFNLIQNLVYPLMFFVSNLMHILTEAKVATPNLWNEYGFFNNQYKDEPLQWNLDKKSGKFYPIYPLVFKEHSL